MSSLEQQINNLAKQQDTTQNEVITNSAAIAALSEQNLIIMGAIAELMELRLGGSE